MLPEYDFRGGVRGKYAQRYREGVSITVYSPSEDAVRRKATTLMPIESDVVKYFPNSKAVNDALRYIIAAMPKEVRRQKAA